MKDLRGKLSMTILVVIYVLVSLRLFPGDWLKTLRATGWHLLTIAPYTVGCTIIFASTLRKLSKGGKVPWVLIFRIFITVSLILEFFLGIYDYVT